MNRDSEAQLLDFCACQQAAFEQAAWLESKPIPPNEMAAICLFLSGTDWYGYSEKLVNLAETLLPGCSQKLGSLLRDLRFDALRFSSQLKRRLRHA